VVSCSTLLETSEAVFVEKNLLVWKVLAKLKLYLMHLNKQVNNRL